MKGKYSGTCKECGDEFYGRLNQVYCCSGCKIKHNNHKARLTSVGVREDLDRMKNGYRILKDIVNEFGEDNEVDIEELHRRGFHNETPYMAICIDGYRGDWSKVGDLAYQIIKERRKLRILKMKTDELY